MGFILRILAGKAGPWILLGLVLAIIGGAAAIRITAYSDGKESGTMTERQSWQKVAERARLLADQLAAERQARKDDAAAARAERDSLFESKSHPITLEVRDYAKGSAAASRCIDTVGVRIGQKAIDAANQALTGGSGGSGAAVPKTP